MGFLDGLDTASYWKTNHVIREPYRKPKWVKWFQDNLKTGNVRILFGHTFWLNVTKLMGSVNVIGLDIIVTKLTEYRSKILDYLLDLNAFIRLENTTGWQIMPWSKTITKFANSKLCLYLTWFLPYPQVTKSDTTNVGYM